MCRWMRASIEYDKDIKKDYEYEHDNVSNKECDWIYYEYNSATWMSSRCFQKHR